MNKILLFSILLPILKPSAVEAQSKDLQKFGSRIDYSHRMKKMILKDGSIAWIHFTPIGENLEFFYYPNSDRVRTAIKRGAVLFEVAKDTLTLYCDPLKVISPGNSFFIAASKRKIAITPLYQHVLIMAKSGERMAIGVGETVSFRKKRSAFSKKPTTKTRRREIIQGTDYELNFKNTSLEKIAMELGKKWDKKIHVRTLLKKESITINLVEKTLDESIDLIAGLFNATYTIENDNIYIKK